MDVENKLPSGQRREPDVSTPESVRRLLQAFCMGIVTGDKSLRDKLEGSDFSYYEYEKAFNSLKEGSYVFFEKLLEEEFGLLWDAKDGSPIPAAFERLKLDSKKCGLMLDLLSAISDQDGMLSDFHYKQFIDDVKEAVGKIE